MLSTNQALRGRNVYGNGSFAPNTGRVSGQGTMGYVAREQRRQNGLSQRGNDGQSDTRSGLAAQAMGRQQSFNRPGQQQNNRPNNASWKPGKNNNHWQPGANASQPNGAASGQSAGTVPATVTINDAGTLELPYDQEWSMDLIGATGDYNSQLLELQAAQQQQAMEYQRGKSDLAKAYESTQRDTLNTGAGTGAAFSSAYGVAVGRNALDNQNANNDLDTQNSLFQQNTNAQRLAIQNAFNQLLQQAAAERAAAAAEQAGSLGYGQSGSGSGASGGRSGQRHPNSSGGQNGQGNSGRGGSSNSSWKPGKAVKTPYVNHGRRH